MRAIISSLLSFQLICFHRLCVACKTKENMRSILMGSLCDASKFYSNKMYDLEMLNVVMAISMAHFKFN